jgi:hypothetical protein
MNLPTFQCFTPGEIAQEDHKARPEERRHPFSRGQ